MPKKGHRAASRQAQLRRRKRRDRDRTQVFDAGPTEAGAAEVVSDPVEVGEEDVQAPETAVQPARRPVARASRRQAAQPVARQRPAAEPVSSQRFLGGELRRIGIITSLMVVILAVLTVFLR